MIRSGKYGAIAAIAAAAIIIAAAAFAASSGTPADPGPKSTLRIAVVTDALFSDRGWGESALNAARFIESEYGFEVATEDNVSIADIEPTLEEYAEGHDASLEYEPDGEIAVEADRERITQVISNLLDNALKFTKDGRVAVTAKKGDDGSVSVSVKDTGIGIAPDIMPRLFTKFASKSERGTGLGLFISKSIVEAHGGKIWGSNNENEGGATFTFTIP